MKPRRWWYTPELGEWRRMHEAGHYPHNFFHWPNYKGDEESGYPLGQGWFIPRTVRIKLDMSDTYTSGWGMTLATNK